MRKFIIHMVYWFRYYGGSYSGKKFEPDSKFGGILGLSILQWINLLTVLAIIQLYTKYDAADNFFLSWWPNDDLKRSDIRYYLYGALAAAPFFISNYFIIYRTTTQKEIDTYFKSLSKKQLEISKIVFFSYIILTFITGFTFGSKFTEKFKKDKPNQSIYRK